MKDIATKNNVTIYTVNRFSYNNISSTENTIYTNSDLKGSPFYLNKKKTDRYDSFLDSKKTSINDLLLLDKQEFADFWVLYKNKESYNKFISELRKSNITFKEVSVDISDVEYPYKTDYDKAIIAMVSAVCAINLSLALINSKDISLRLIYQKKTDILKYYLFKSFLGYVLATSIVFIILLCSLFLYNGLSRFDIVLQVFLPTSLFSIVGIMLLELVSFVIVVCKIDLVASLKNYISNSFIFKLLNILTIISLVFASYFIQSIYNSLTFLKVDRTLISNASKYGVEKDRYIFNIMYRYASNDDEINGKLNQNIMQLTMLLQNKYEAEFIDYIDKEICVNENYLKTHNLIDQDNKIIKAINSNKQFKLKKEMTIYDYSQNKLVTTKNIHIIKDSDVYVTGGVDLTTSPRFNYKDIYNDMKNMGIDNAFQGVSTVNFDLVNKQEDMVMFVTTQSLFNLILFYSIAIFSSYINFQIYIEIEKKKIGLMNIYSKSILKRYQKLFIINFINYILIYIIINSLFENDVISEFLVISFIINNIFIIIYSKFQENKNLTKWLNGG